MRHRSVHACVTTICFASIPFYNGLALGAGDVHLAQVGATGSGSISTAEGMQKVEEVVVTGSHITRSGYESTQPVTSVDSATLQAAAPANIADFAVKLPALAGSNTPNNSSGFMSNGKAGIASMNLRSLGVNRTLVLVDGQRWVPSSVDGDTDVNTIPQALITGIDVTTGGASAAYGSGAVGGVVNFILDKAFTGVKTDYQYGEYQLYDAPQNKFTLTAGTGFADNRGHVLFSGEASDQRGNLDGVPQFDHDAYFSMPNSAANIAAGGPQVLMGRHIGISTYTPGGLITAGPLKGTYFGVVGPNGVPSVNQLVYGDPVGSQWMQGGDYEYTNSSQFGYQTLMPRQSRENVFGRLSFNLTDSTEVYAELNWGHYHGLAYVEAQTTSGVAVSINNPYLPASVVTAMKAANITSLTMGTANSYFGSQLTDMARTAKRASAGINSSFEVFGESWKWNAHAQAARTNTDETLPGSYNVGNYTNAVNAVLGPDGTPQCASAAARAQGCQPLNIFGVNPNQSAAALDYVLGDPQRRQQFELREFAAEASTNDIPSWGAPISLAVGVEARRESVSGEVPREYDPNFGNTWRYGNFVATNGHYDAVEGYVETLVPILQGLDFNGGFRYTDYSTSGGTNSWKLGLTWRPISDLTFRATRSSDIRAGNLGELFAPGTALTNAVTNPWDNGNSLRYLQQLMGSTKIKPETASTDVFGIVFQPRMVPGLQASIDYFDIQVDDVISSLSAQQEVDACYYNQVQKYCDNLLLNNYGLPSSGTGQPVIIRYYENLNKLTEKGMDFEVSYPIDLSSLWSPLGRLTLHATATHAINYTSNNGVTSINVAGSNSPRNTSVIAPNWIGRFETMYNQESWSFNLVTRFISSGNMDDASNKYIQCSANCTPATGIYRTSNVTHAPGQVVFDGTLTKRLDLFGAKETSVYLAVRNLLNRQPPVMASPSSGYYGAENTPAYPQTHYFLYDYLGRQFTLGARVQF
jgi:outer membrane receptor protein involved in Fe transport